MLGTDRALLALGHHGNPIRGDALGDEVAYGRRGAALAEGQVVLVGTAFEKLVPAGRLVSHAAAAVLGWGLWVLARAL